MYHLSLQYVDQISRSPFSTMCSSADLQSFRTNVEVAFTMLSTNEPRPSNELASNNVDNECSVAGLLIPGYLSSVRHFQDVDTYPQDFLRILTLFVSKVLSRYSVLVLYWNIGHFFILTANTSVILSYNIALDCHYLIYAHLQKV